MSSVKGTRIHLYFCFQVILLILFVRLSFFFSTKQTVFPKVVMGISYKIVIVEEILSASVCFAYLLIALVLFFLGTSVTIFPDRRVQWIWRWWALSFLWNSPVTGSIRAARKVAVLDFADRFCWWWRSKIDSNPAEKACQLYLICLGFRRGRHTKNLFT